MHKVLISAAIVLMLSCISLNIHAQTVAQQQPAASPKVRRIAIAESAKLVQRGVAHAQLLRSTAQRTLQFLVTANARQLPHASRSAPVDGFRQAAPTALGLKVR